MAVDKLHNEGVGQHGWWLVVYFNQRLGPWSNMHFLRQKAKKGQKARKLQQN